MVQFPTPVGGASLLLSFRLAQKTVLIIGSNTLAATRAFSALEADSTVVVISRGVDSACEELRWRASRKQLTILDWSNLHAAPSPSHCSEDDAELLDSFLSHHKNVLLACVTDTLLGADVASRRSRDSAEQLAMVCKKHNIPINVTDHPDLCDFSFTSTHRFEDPETNAPTPLQIGITTNGHGCRLASRVRREIVAKLPKDVGRAVRNVGRLRESAKDVAEVGELVGDPLSEDALESTPNIPVPQRGTTETSAECTRRRMKWVAQVSEYWPISRLATMSDKEMKDILDGRSGVYSEPCDLGQPRLCHTVEKSLHSLALSDMKPTGKIYLVGSGPGHPSLLTLATHAALTRYADLVLSDKLVPAAVLDLIPKHVEIRIARKFPGNADGAQQELMDAAVDALRRGLTVVRLKQGDPTVYGRAGEEVLFLRAHGFEPIVVPGVSSALAGPTFAGIPVTQRGAAESFIVCTGVGRQGKGVRFPGYERSRTLVILMGVARLPEVLAALQSEDPNVSEGRRDGAPYPMHLPIAIIERATMPDQRAIFSTLENIGTALQSAGEQRPPGMLVVGWSVLSLWGSGDLTILEDDSIEHDVGRIEKWLEGKQWRTTEGLQDGWGLDT
ncbi:uroporphyrin-III C-methyltransferase [Panus rudis PR-1116 ss-1]|nr:uroporphyrin-III C-methyltransferase [Panus rudis PR-1116 ss-1]